MFDEGTYIWTILIAILTVVLGVAIFYGRQRSKKVTPGEKLRGEQATHDLYEREDKGKLP